jgi:GNAT superfamily N-acetyltransferase
MVALDRAIEVFAYGFAFTRSFTHPYCADQLQPGVWALRDAPRARGDYRSEEYVASNADAAALDLLAQRTTRGRYKLCVIQPIGERDTDTRAAFRALGYRLMGSEAMMIHRLAELAPPACAYPVARVINEEQAQVLAKAAGSRQILPQRLSADPAPMRQYMALDDVTPVGWVGSVAVGDATWCTNLFVAPQYRRQGIGRALIAQMLADDKAAGARVSVLLASHVGAQLYPTLGYETIGTLLLFAPPKR